FAATRVIVEPLSGDPDRPVGIVQRPDIPFAAKLVVVNDDPDITGAGTVRWTVTRERAVSLRGVSRIRDVAQRKSFSGASQCEVPTAFEPAIHATTVSLQLTAEGEYRLEAILSLGGEEIDRSELKFTVTS